MIPRSLRAVAAALPLAWLVSSAMAHEPATDAALTPLVLDELRERMREEAGPTRIIDDEVPRRVLDAARHAMDQAGLPIEAPQYLLVVDRNPAVQTMYVVHAGNAMPASMLGAFPVSTGRTGSFDHFETPLGVFAHTPENPDFRAEGTRNEFGIRGYGMRGMRVFDFGWQQARQGWGSHRIATMRLQMHATDPDLLEPKLGTVQSKGCIRIPSAVNAWIDHYGVLDAAYDELAASDARRCVLHPSRIPTADRGRYLVVIDSSAVSGTEASDR